MYRIAFAATLGLATAAYAQTAPAQTPPAPMPPSHSQHMAPAPKTPVTPSTKAYRAASAKMHKDMAFPYTGDADRDFAAGMIPHHQGAIDMSKALLLYGKDRELQQLAKSIIAEQQTEIQLMRLWLAKHPSSAKPNQPGKPEKD